MGGDVRLIMASGEAKKVKVLLNGKDLLAPSVEGLLPASCWVTYHSNKIYIGWSAGEMFKNMEWSQAIAVEIIKRFHVIDAGYDSIGYCGVDAVGKSRPFGVALSRCRISYSKEEATAYPDGIRRSCCKLI